MVRADTSARAQLVIVFAAAILTSGATCTGATRQEISRERAIDIARQQVSFTPDSVDAMRTTAASRPVWRVTFRGRLPGQPPGLFETAIVEIDRRTGDIVSIGRT